MARIEPKTLRIGAGAGFQGDRIDPAVVLASQGGLDYLVLECLAERTIAAAQLRRLQEPGTGFDPLLEARMEALLPFVERSGLRIVTNMGAADPVGAGKVTIAIARRLNLRVKVAAVTGDDVLRLVKPGMTALETGRALRAHGRLVSANAYLGAEALLPALARGANVVITGRVADPSLFLAPLVHEFGWALDDWDRLARGTVVGHLLECAGQVTGGYFADPGAKDVPDLAHLGFPFADVDADGFASISKVPGTGGAVTVRTVKEQLLYEVTDPTGYVTPDVTLDLRGVRVAEVGPDRVAVGGATGRARTDTLKASVGYLAGWLGEGELTYAGANARARAALAAGVLRERLQEAVPDLELRIDHIGVDSAHKSSFGHAHDPYEVRLRVAGRADRRAVAERIGWEVEALLTNGPAGGGGLRKSVAERIGIVSTLLPRAKVAAEVTLLQSRYAAKAR
ncbi:MAG: acyclic terpene utilization AtuA family protein [Burkholderiales bacterium]|nr:acyclic terpene utilization AtuA family protein [Burkholderiales bacterium]